MYTASNNLENLELYLEHDSGYADWALTPEDLEEAGMAKLVFHGGDADEPAVLEGCSYIKVDTNYCLNLSPGQQRLYEILVALQEGAVFTVTTISKLAQAMGLENPLAAMKRLENLQSLGAIAGLRLQ
jgi:hypothetical protein